MKDGGHDVGVISVSQSFSVPMILKSFFFKMAGKKTNNIADNYSAVDLLKLAYNKLFNVLTFLSEEQNAGLNIFRIDGFYYLPPSANYNHFGWLKAGNEAVKKYIQRYGKPDVIHAHNALYGGLLAEKVSKEYNIPYIVTEHSTAFARNEIKNKKLLERAKSVYENSKAVFAVSKPFSELLNNMFGITKVQPLPNVLDPYLENLPIERKQSDSDFIFINIAELHPKKDHALLIKAFKGVLKEYPDTKLWIGGDGELKEELKSLVAELGLEHSVKMLGPLNRQQVYECISQADCFVLSSKFETFGVVVIESMLFGKPVIVTRCGGPETLVDDKTGIIVEKEDEMALTNAMKQMVKNHTRYDNNYIRAQVIDKFGRKQFLQTMNEVYKKIA